MLLILRPDIHIHNSGCVYEVPIVENDVIDLHQDLYDSQIRRFPSQPPHRHQRESPSMVPAPNIFPSVEPSSGLDPRSYDRIRQNFKCPKFSGKPKDWKVWDKGLQRYLSIWELQHVLDADFLIMPLSQAHHRDNKLVYYIIEEAVQQSALASSYVRKSPLNNGFEAYYTLLEGFVFAGTTTASLLLNELTGFRFLSSETPTALVLRLQELFHDLASLPGEAAMQFNDTQKIGYLLNTLRPEKEWQTVHSALTSRQINGDITFVQACAELTVRCEANRAAELMDRPITNKTVRIGAAQLESLPSSEASDDQVLAYISTQVKKRNLDLKRLGGRKPRPQLPCLAKGCEDSSPFSLCGTHYHSVIAGKTPSLELRNNYGFAKFDESTKLIVYPDKVPSDRLPSNVKRVIAASAKLDMDE
jgi:hypothetical protein